MSNAKLTKPLTPTETKGLLARVGASAKLLADDLHLLRSQSQLSAEDEQGQRAGHLRFLYITLCGVLILDPRGSANNEPITVDPILLSARATEIEKALALFIDRLDLLAKSGEAASANIELDYLKKRPGPYDFATRRFVRATKKVWTALTERKPSATMVGGGETIPHFVQFCRSIAELRPTPGDTLECLFDNPAYRKRLGEKAIRLHLKALR